MLLIAPSSSYRIAPYLRAAKALGYHILVASNSAHSIVPQVAMGIAVDFDRADEAFEAILAAIENLTILCVLATDDNCVELASRISAYLNLPHNPVEAALLTHRKDLARQALEKAGCRIPKFRIIEIDFAADDEPGLDFPLVVKPLSLSASRGVIRVDDRSQLHAACKRIDRILESAALSGFVRHHLLIESYLDGDEFAIEGFVIDGQFQLLTIFDKPEPLTGPYFEETYYITPSRLDESSKGKLIDEISKCCTAYGLRQGPVHAEARITGKGPVLLELAARTIGGQCGQLIEFSLGKKLEEIVIQGMCGTRPEESASLEAAGVLMIPVTESGILKRVEGLTEAMKVNYIVDIEIHIREGYELVPLPEGASYLGFIFARAENPRQVYQALKTAHRKLRFVTQKTWKINPL